MYTIPACADQTYFYTTYNAKKDKRLAINTESRHFRLQKVCQPCRRFEPSPSTAFLLFIRQTGLIMHTLTVDMDSPCFYSLCDGEPFAKSPVNTAPLSP
jgi:hypothetical protein